MKCIILFDVLQIQHTVQTCGVDSSFSSITLILTEKMDLINLLRVIRFFKIMFFFYYIMIIIVVL